MQVLRGRAALLDAGETAYPVLLASVPQWNGGWDMTPATAAAALVELRRFEAGHPAIPMDRLVGPRDEPIGQVPRGGTAWFFTSTLTDGTPVVAGIVGGAFGVWPDGDPPRPVFSTRVAEQRAVGDHPLERSDPETGRVLRPAVPVDLTDPATGRSVGLRRSVCENASRFEVVTLDVGAVERYLALGQLLDLCLASERTGHHVLLG